MADRGARFRCRPGRDFNLPTHARRQAGLDVLDGRRRLLAWATLALTAGAGVAGCGGGGGTTAQAGPNQPAHAAQGRFDPGAFGNPARGVNRWDPLRPGRQSVSEGRVNVGHRRLTHRRVYTVTDVTKRIDGVRAVVVLDQDLNGGQLAEQALDYLAEDRRGNLWSLGSYTETYEGGRFVNATDAWLSGVRGAGAGVLLPARPRPGATFYERRALGEEREPARVVKVGASKCVPFRCYRDVVVIGEGLTSSEPEYKYYAPGVGEIKTEPRYQGGEQETELLINARLLSHRGLTELSREAVKVDRHARVVAPAVFGRSAPAGRGL